MNVQHEALIDDLLGRMDLADKVGQCMVCNFVGTRIDDYHRRFIENLRCGGLRVTPHISNLEGEPRVRKLSPYMGPGEYAGVIRELQERAMRRRSGIPLQIVTDQEGDLSVDIVRGGLRFFPSNAGMAATNRPALVRKAYKVVGQQLRALGVTWVHGPVLDVNQQPRNPEIGMRSFSDDPAIVARYGIAEMKGLLAAGVVATGKHFPGRGDSELDAHDTLDVLRVDRQRLDRVELAPYRRLIQAGLPAIMTAHNAYSALDVDTVPASVSRRIVTGLLREEMGFEGVVTTDAIGMAGLIDYAGTHWNAVVMALEAGNDIVLVKEDEATTVKCFQAIMDAVSSGRLNEARLEESVRRILRLKAAIGILDRPLPDPAKADRTVRSAAAQAVCEETHRAAAIVVRDRQGLLPLDPQEKILVVEQYIPLYHVKANDAYCHPGLFGEAMRRHSDRLLYQEMNTPPDETDVRRYREFLAQVDTVVFFNTFWRGSGSNRPLIREAVKAGKKVAVAGNDLYDAHFLPTIGTFLCTFSAMPEGLRTAADLLYGKAQASGTWPLTLLVPADTVADDVEVDHFTAGHFAHR